MHPPSRTRRILKWTGAGLLLMTISIWAASFWWEFTFVFTRSTAAWIYSGSIRFVVAEFDVMTEWGLKPNIRQRRYLESGFRWPEFEDKLLTTLRPYPVPQGVYSRGLIPLWLVVISTALPTAWLWYHDRRRIRPGHCPRCGYNLTGNTSGVCSECGLANPPPATV